MYLIASFDQLWRTANIRGILETNFNSEDGSERDARRLETMNDLAKQERALPISFTLFAMLVAKVAPSLEVFGVSKRISDDVTVASWSYFSPPEDLSPSEILIGLSSLILLALICNRVCPYRTHIARLANEILKAFSIIQGLKKRILAVDGDGSKLLGCEKKGRHLTV